MEQNWKGIKFDFSLSVQNIKTVMFLGLKGEKNN
jgi:hypothetical protein